MASRKSSSDNSSPSSSQQNLVFVNVSNPAAIDSQSVRRLVRSSATRHSHRDPTRKPKARKANRSAGTSSSRKTSPKPLIASGRSSPDEEEPSTALIVQQTNSLFTQHDRLRVANILDQPMHESETANMMKVGQSEQYAAPPNSYPVDAEEWFPWVLSYYRTVYLPQGISILQLSDDEGDTFITWFMKEGNSESALFYMQLLTACTQLVNGDRLPSSHIDWLRAMVVRSINEAIGDSTRMTSTATLLAVALIALHERLYGDKILATEVHGRAFARMIDMRGGFEQVHLPRLAWRLLLWIDVVVADLRADTTSTRLLDVWVSEHFRPIQPD